MIIWDLSKINCLNEHEFRFTHRWRKYVKPGALAQKTESSQLSAMFNGTDPVTPVQCQQRS